MLSNEAVALQAEACADYVRRGGKLLAWLNSKDFGIADVRRVVAEIEDRKLREQAEEIGA